MSAIASALYAGIQPSIRQVFYAENRRKGPGPALCQLYNASQVAGSAAHQTAWWMGVTRHLCANRFNPVGRRVLLGFKIGSLI
jgi:hypothetical protein